jgi:hypothetical protein
MTTNINFIITDPLVPMDEVENTLRLARLAVESLHGEDRVAIETVATIDHASRSCLIDTTVDTGRALAVVFAGYVRREFGNAAVRVQRVTFHPEGGER